MNLVTSHKVSHTIYSVVFSPNRDHAEAPMAEENTNKKLRNSNDTDYMDTEKLPIQWRWVEGTKALIALLKCIHGIKRGR